MAMRLLGRVRGRLSSLGLRTRKSNGKAVIEAPADVMLRLLRSIPDLSDKAQQPRYHELHLTIFTRG